MVSDGSTAYAGIVSSFPRDDLGVWSVKKLSDGSESPVPFQSMFPRKLYVPTPKPDQEVPEPELEVGDGALCCRFVAPADGKGAAEGGRWTVSITGSLGGSAAAADEEEDDNTPDRVPAVLLLPEAPALAERKASLPPFGEGGDRVARASGVIGELGLSVAKLKHEPCVASGDKTSNQVHHDVLPVDGHIVVTLLVKGQKKKELIMVVKKATTKLNLKEFGKVVGVVGGAVRMADAKALDANLGITTDFVSPLALVNTLDAGIAMHKVSFTRNPHHSLIPRDGV